MVRSSSSAVHRSKANAAKTRSCRVRAQRKFAQGQRCPPSSGRFDASQKRSVSVNGTVTGPVASAPTRQQRATQDNDELLDDFDELPSHERPKTEDFLTFLCFRGSRRLPPELGIFNYPPAVQASFRRSSTSTSSSPASASSEGDLRCTDKRHRAPSTSSSSSSSSASSSSCSSSSVSPPIVVRRESRCVSTSSTDKKRQPLSKHHDASVHRTRSKAATVTVSKTSSIVAAIKQKYVNAQRQKQQRCRVADSSTRVATRSTASATTKPKKQEQQQQQPQQQATERTRSKGRRLGGGSRMLLRLTPRGTTDTAFYRSTRKIDLKHRSLRSRDISAAERQQRRQRRKVTASRVRPRVSAAATEQSPKRARSQSIVDLQTADDSHEDGGGEKRHNDSDISSDASSAGQLVIDEPSTSSPTVERSEHAVPDIVVVDDAIPANQPSLPPPPSHVEQKQVKKRRKSSTSVDIKAMQAAVLLQAQRSLSMSVEPPIESAAVSQILAQHRRLLPKPAVPMTLTTNQTKLSLPPRPPELSPQSTPLQTPPPPQLPPHQSPPHLHVNAVEDVQLVEEVSEEVAKDITENDGDTQVQEPDSADNDLQRDKESTNLEDDVINIDRQKDNIKDTVVVESNEDNNIQEIEDRLSPHADDGDNEDTSEVAVDDSCVVDVVDVKSVTTESTDDVTVIDAPVVREIVVTDSAADVVSNASVSATTTASSVTPAAESVTSDSAPPSSQQQQEQGQADAAEKNDAASSARGALDAAAAALTASLTTGGGSNSGISKPLTYFIPLANLAASGGSASIATALAQANAGALGVAVELRQAADPASTEAGCKTGDAASLPSRLVMTAKIVTKGDETVPPAEISATTSPKQSEENGANDSPLRGKHLVGRVVRPVDARAMDAPPDSLQIGTKKELSRCGVSSAERQQRRRRPFHCGGGGLTSLGRIVRCEAIDVESNRRVRGRLVEGPSFRMTDDQFVALDPLAVIFGLHRRCESFGMAKLIPPASFKTECHVQDDMRFPVYNQYVAKLHKRWGPASRVQRAIHKYNAEHVGIHIKRNQMPAVAGFELDLGALYDAVHHFGGAAVVISAKLWPSVAAYLRLPQRHHGLSAAAAAASTSAVPSGPGPALIDWGNKLDDIYCKYVLPYDTLADEERAHLLRLVDDDYATLVDRRRRRQRREQAAADGMTASGSTSNRSDASDNASDNSESESEDDEDEGVLDCICRGKSVSLGQFFRLARVTHQVVFQKDATDGSPPQTADDVDGVPLVRPCPVPPSIAASNAKADSTQQQPSSSTLTDLIDVETEFWRIVRERDCHLVTYQGSIDTMSGARPEPDEMTWGFPTHRTASGSRHAWNLKMMANNPRSLLRWMGPMLGLTIPTLHIAMTFTAGCWHIEPHGLTTVEYLHTGAPKVWYAVAASQGEALRRVMRRLVPDVLFPQQSPAGVTASTQPTLWLPADVTMVPVATLMAEGIAVSRTVQYAGEYVVIYPGTCVASLATGYCIAESVFVADNAYLAAYTDRFAAIRAVKEPMLFPPARLLVAVARAVIAQLSSSGAEAVDVHPSSAVGRAALQLATGAVAAQLTSLVTAMRDGEYVKQAMIVDAGVKSQSQTVRLKKHKHDQEDEYECSKCAQNLYVSFLHDPTDDLYFCLDHGLAHLHSLKSAARRRQCQLMETMSKEAVADLSASLNRIVEAVSTSTGGGVRSDRVEQPVVERAVRRCYHLPRASLARQFERFATQSDSSTSDSSSSDDDDDDAEEGDASTSTAAATSAVTTAVDEDTSLARQQRRRQRGVMNAATTSSSSSSQTLPVADSQGKRKRRDQDVYDLPSASSEAESASKTVVGRSASAGSAKRTAASKRTPPTKSANAPKRAAAKSETGRRKVEPSKCTSSPASSIASSSFACVATTAAATTTAAASPTAATRRRPATKRRAAAVAGARRNASLTAELLDMILSPTSSDDDDDGVAIATTSGRRGQQSNKSGRGGGGGRRGGSDKATSDSAAADDVVSSSNGDDGDNPWK